MDPADKLLLDPACVLDAERARRARRVQLKWLDAYNAGCR
jgi:hypothetical protein